MLALLAIIFSGLAVGKLARRMTPAVELLLLLLVTAIVLLQYVTTTATGRTGGTDLLLRWLLPGTR